MTQNNENIDIDRNEKRPDPSKVASTFIKYGSYIIILLIVLWFLINYILPMF